jgi:hypothetical protein
MQSSHPDNIKLSSQLKINPANILFLNKLVIFITWNEDFLTCHKSQKDMNYYAFTKSQQKLTISHTVSTIVESNSLFCVETKNMSK